MSVNVNTLYTRSQDIANNAQGSGYLDPDTWNNFANLVVEDILNEEFKVFQNTQIITDTLKPWIKKILLPVNSGICAYPNNFRYYIASRTYDLESYKTLVTTCGTNGTEPDYSVLAEVDIKLIDNDKFGKRSISKLLPPSYEYPIMVSYYDGFHITPNDIGILILDYLRQPATIKWNYQISTSTGLPEYVATGSTDFDGDAGLQNKIITGILTYFGFSVREAELAQPMSQLNQQQP